LISDEEYCNIQQAVNDKLFDLQCQFYDRETWNLLEGKTEEDFDKAYDEYDENGKYEFIKEKFGYTKEEFKLKENAVEYELTGYKFEEITLYEGADEVK